MKTIKRVDLYYIYSAVDAIVTLGAIRAPRRRSCDLPPHRHHGYLLQDQQEARRWTESRLPSWPVAAPRRPHGRGLTKPPGRVPVRLRPLRPAGCCARRQRLQPSRRLTPSAAPRSRPRPTCRRGPQHALRQPTDADRVTGAEKGDTLAVHIGSILPRRPQPRHHLHHPQEFGGLVGHAADRNVERPAPSGSRRWS